MLLTPISKVSELYDRDIVSASESDLSLDESHTFEADEPKEFTSEIDEPAEGDEE